MYNITFQQIEVFLTVARFLNISKAAENLYISQPTLSKALNRFERGVGFRVFTRSNQGVALTPQGEYLCSMLESLYNGMAKAIKAANALTPEPKKVLRIVAPSSYDTVDDYNLLKRCVQKYSEAYPDVTLSDELCDFQELRQKLEFGNTDIAFSHSFTVADIPGIKYRHICEYKMYLAVSAHHPMALYDSIQPDMLSELTLFAVPSTDESTATEGIISRYSECGFIPKRIEFIDNFPTLLHMLREKRGVSICARFKDIASNEVPNDIKYFPLNLDKTRVYVVVAWHDDGLSKEARNFLKMLPDDESAI